MNKNKQTLLSDLIALAGNKVIIEESDFIMGIAAGI
jgi:hypothetical protein